VPSQQHDGFPSVARVVARTTNLVLRVENLTSASLSRSSTSIRYAWPGTTARPAVAGSVPRVFKGPS